MSLWDRYGRAAAAFAILVVTAIQATLSDSATAGRITDGEGVQICVALVTATTVYVVPNVPAWPWLKTFLAITGGGLQVLAVLIVDGMDPADWTAVILGGATMVLVPLAPSKSKTAAVGAATAPL